VCRHFESIEAVNRAADALSAACLKIKPPVAKSLRALWDEEVGRGLTLDDLSFLAELDRKTARS
jgi:hypothetical protein